MQSNTESNIRKVGPRGAVKRRRGRPKGSTNKRPREEVLEKHKDNAEWLSARVVAMRYGIYPGTVRAWARKGKLPAPYLIGDNTVRWKRSELDERDAESKPVRYRRPKS